MSSMMNAFRSAATPARHFTSLNITSSVSTKAAVQPELNPVVLKQLVDSLNTASVSSSKQSLSKASSKRL
ncbi:hypothetical protein BGZ74_009041 [Mortierella antarctica]|nr:hypothetical protein BGZ74_009041 [Mortierella antarctica]KAG0345650.1 hypothetical protein BG005_001206 [Podila minutissima]